MTPCPHNRGWALCKIGVNKRFAYVFVDNEETDYHVAFDFQGLRRKDYSLRFQCNKGCGAVRNIYLKAEVSRWGKVRKGKPEELA